MAALATAMASGLTVVIGGGVAGCAAAVAVTRAGGACVLVEARRNLGGVAAQGEHRTLCGLSPLDGTSAQLLEPELVGPWLPLLVTGEPYRQGRVWLYPTEARHLQQGLRRGVGQAGVELRLGSRACMLEHADAVTALICSTAAGVSERLPCSQVIDASGSGVLSELLGRSRLPATQWASCRAVVQLPAPAPGAASRAQRVRWLTAMHQVLALPAAIALTPLGGELWQLSLDVPPGSSRSDAETALQRAAQAIDAAILQVTLALAERDAGRPQGTLTLEALFAQEARGLCWASWPREEHTAQGVQWTYPPRSRYGVPPEAVALPGAPRGCWCIGKGMAVGPDAAAALRVTGTCLAVGAAVGALAAAAARSRQIDAPP